MKLLKKIQASAMHFAVLVAGMVALLLMLFLTLSKTQYYFDTRSDYLLKTLQESEDGILKALDKNFNIDDTLQHTEDKGSLYLQNDFWGGFKLLHASSSIKHLNAERKALVGSVNKLSRTAVYISDVKLPLVMVGHSKISGSSWISDQGVKTGVIAGRYFNGKSLIKGQINLSQNFLPPLNPDWRLYIKKILDTYPDQESVMPYPEEFSNSFFVPTRYVFDYNTITLFELLTGNIIVKSDKEVVVKKESKLKDILIVAPRIHIQAGFKGNIHLIASENIKIDSLVQLKYPSSLVLLKDKSFLEENSAISEEEPISIGSHTSFEGIVILLQDKKQGARSKTDIRIEKDTTIKGELYCEGNLELKGKVAGSVFTERFVVNDFGAIYLNHIYDGQIVASDLSSEYGGLPFANQDNTIVQWLY